MANRLKNILRFTNLVVGVQQQIPHLLNVNGVAQIPDKGDLSQGFFTVSADATNVSITRLPGDPDNVDVYVEVWHTFDREFGAFSGSQPSGLVPRPYFSRSGAGTSAVASAGITRWDGFITTLLANSTLAYALDGGAGSAAAAPIGAAAPGSVVGLYIFNVGALTAGTMTLTVLHFAGSTGAPVVLGPGVLQVALAAAGFVAFAEFDQGLFPYAAGDQLGLAGVTSAAFAGGEATGSNAMIVMQDD